MKNPSSLFARQDYQTNCIDKILKDVTSRSPSDLKNLDNLANTETANAITVKDSKEKVYRCHEYM